MKKLTSTEVQKHFGAIANIIKGGEIVAVTEHGTPTLMILPYALASEALQAYNARKLAGYMDAMPIANPTVPDLTIDQINTIVHEVRP